MVSCDVGEDVEGERAKVVNATTHAQAKGAATFAGAPHGVVVGDRAATDRQTGRDGPYSRADKDAAAEAVAAVAAESAVAADRHVVGDRTAAEGDGAVVRAAGINRPAAYREAAAPASAAVGSGAPVPAGRLVEGHGDVGNGRGRVPVHRQAAAEAVAARGPAAAGAADGGVVREGR